METIRAVLTEKEIAQALMEFVIRRKRPQYRIREGDPNFDGTVILSREDFTLDVEQARVEVNLQD